MPIGTQTLCEHFFIAKSIPFLNKISIEQIENLLAQFETNFEDARKKKKKVVDIEALDKEFHLLDSFEKNLIIFKGEVKLLSTKLSFSEFKNSGSSDIDSLKIRNRSYSEHIAIRLKFLDFIYRGSPTLFTEDRSNFQKKKIFLLLHRFSFSYFWFHTF